MCVDVVAASLATVSAVSTALVGGTSDSCWCPMLIQMGLDWSAPPRPDPQFDCLPPLPETQAQEQLQHQYPWAGGRRLLSLPMTPLLKQNTPYLKEQFMATLHHRIASIQPSSPIDSILDLQGVPESVSTLAMALLLQAP